MEIQKNVVVVIGVGGMGQLIARRQGAGRRLVIADFDEKALSTVATTLSGEGFDVTSMTVDVSDAGSVEALAANAAELGPVTEVIHTAGLSPSQAPKDAILAVDLLGVAHMLDAFGSVIAPGGAGVVIASMAGLFAQGRLPAETEAALASTPTDELAQLPIFEQLPDAGQAYSIAKRANQVRVAAASIAWGVRGARINSVSPGVISTPMGAEELASEAGAGMREMINASGTGRIGTPTDIAAATAFLLSSEASFITGTDLAVDGGVTAAVRSGAISLG